MTYLLKSIIVVLTMLLQVLLCWFIALFVKRDGNFISLFRWAQPYDTLAIGDELFHNNEMVYTKDWHWLPRNYWLALQWSGLRNPGWGMMGIMGFKKGEITDYTESAGQVDIGDGGNVFGSVKRTCTNDGQAYWNYKKVGKWNDTYGYMLEVGWILCDVKSAPDGDIRRLCIDIRPRIKL